MSKTRRTLGLLCASAALLCSPAAAAQSEEQLFEQGRTAYYQHEWAGALKYLFAYHSTNPANYVDHTHRQQVLDAIARSEREIKKALDAQRRAQSASGDSDVGARVSGLTVAALEPPDAASRPPSYLLVCRGGGDMYANYYSAGAGSKLQIHFLKARQGANRRAPGPGECTWERRPVNDKEPFWLSFRADEQIAWISVHANRDVIVRQVGGKNLNRLLNAVVDDHLFRVMAYNDGKHFVITGLK